MSEYSDLLKSYGDLGILLPLGAGGSGLVDQSGNGRDGTAGGAITVGGFSPGPLLPSQDEGATDFPGSGANFVNTPYNPFDNSKAQTFTYWFRRDITTTFSILSNQTGLNYDIVGQITSGVFSLYMNQGIVTWNSGIPTSLSVWTFIACVVDKPNGVARLFVNGSLLSEKSIAGLSWHGGSTMQFGRYSNGSQQFDGKAALIGVTERALDAEQIYRLYMYGIEGSRLWIREKKPPVELAYNLKEASGRVHRIGSSEAEVGNRPLDFSFGTEAGEGFGSAGLAFRREYAGDYPDLAPLNELIAQGVDGQVAYEGRSSGPVRGLDSGGSQVRLDFEGWMSHARQTPFCALGLDADISQWVEPDQTRRLQLLPIVSTLNTSVQPSSEGGLIMTSESGVQIPAFAWAELDYTAPPGVACRGIYYKGTVTNGSGFDFPSFSAGSSYLPLLDDTLRTIEFTTAVGLIAAISRCNANVTPAAGAAYRLGYSVATPFGDHGLSMVPRSDGRPAIQLTDLLVWLFNRWAPKIDTSKVQPNSYPVAHAVWRELTNAQEAAKDLNRYSQWAMGVYEGRALEHRPFDLSVADWQVRAGEDGVEIETQGQTVNDAANGVVVTYTDFAGDEKMVTPEEAADLIDNNPAIAANQWGDKAWIERPISGQCSRDDAIQIGRALLLDFNRPKFPSTIKVKGHIRNGRGQWEQAWRVRSNQTIRVTNHPNDLPRLITKTEWSGNDLTITTDNALNRMDAVLARKETARLAGGIT